MIGIQVNNLVYETLNCLWNQWQPFRTASSESSYLKLLFSSPKSAATLRKRRQKASLNASEGGLNADIFHEALTRMTTDPECLSCIARSLQSVLSVAPTAATLSLASDISQMQRQALFLSSPLLRTVNFSVMNQQTRSFHTKLFKKSYTDAKKHIKEPLGSFEEKLQFYRNDPKKQQALVEGYRCFALDLEEDRKTSYWKSLITNSLLYSLIAAAIYKLLHSSNNSEDHIILPDEKKIESKIGVTFDDVQGCDEAKQQLQDVIGFLKDSSKFKAIGAKLPKGVLLVGPPGVGKTLLAKAVAGEANVSFIHACGSQFEEKFVGIGASRIRNLFKQARANAPCLIFIDEFDAVGKKRSKDPLNPFSNQTVNQLLSEMDGFKSSEGIIVLGATNLPEELDKAILRPGRFDMLVRISLPDLQGRTDLFRLYLQKVKHDSSCDEAIVQFASGTTGSSGADIENIVNQAAIHASIDGRKLVSVNDIWYARDKLMAGPSKKRIPDHETNKLTAYHESGHTLVTIFTPEAIPLHDVTILPRNKSLGHTSMLLDKERYGSTKSQLQAQLDVLMGGRVAEEIIFGPEKIETGAYNDFKVATNIAEQMVKQYGMSHIVGPRTVSDGKNEELSSSMKEAIDNEVHRLLEESYERASKLLHLHLKELHILAEALLKYETLDKDDVQCILNGKTPKRPLPFNPDVKPKSFLDAMRDKITSFGRT